jgi:hypothetical protein
MTDLKQIEEDDKIKYFTASYGDKILKISDSYLNDKVKLLTRLNKMGFQLGSGHEVMDLVKVDDEEYRFYLMPYYGAPNQIVYINLIK